jgi:quercetin dioxygenase-like cupin family protein
MMKRVLQIALPAALLVAVAPMISQTPRPKPLTQPLECPSGDCPLLKGAPQTFGMRSGYVRLKTGQTVGWHTTAGNEETLVIMRGQGEAQIEGRGKVTFTAPAIAYIPPASRHNVENTGKEILEYVYVVAPAKTQ